MILANRDPFSPSNAMEEQPVLGVIPARLGSSRLPRKPLYNLAGRPLIEWVWRRVVQTGACDEVVVATDSEEVASVIRGAGGVTALTRADHPSGTDRVAEVAELAQFSDYSVILNVQGDEPFVDGDHLKVAADLVRSGHWAVGTVAAPIGSVDEWHDPSVVKVVRDDVGGAMIFSRAPVPHPRDTVMNDDMIRDGSFLRHIGIYAYRRDALLKWVELPEGRLEGLERLEQLRPLAAGIRIGVAVVDAAHGGVDTTADAARAEARLQAQFTEEIPDVT